MTWMQTYTGRQFFPTSPRTEDIDILDIAHALSLTCRYGGHVDRFYSVAEHSVLVSQNVPAEHALWGLLHDAAEAYVGDMVRPLKLQMPTYRHVEDRILTAIALKFDLPGLTIPLAVKNADARILLDERAALMKAPPHPWDVDGFAPLGANVVGCKPPAAEAIFLDRFRALTAPTQAER